MSEPTNVVCERIPIAVFFPDDGHTPECSWYRQELEQIPTCECGAAGRYWRELRR